MEEVEMHGPFKLSFSWRAQVVSAMFTLALGGDVGLRTRVLLWGRAWTVDDECYDWGQDPSRWAQFASKVATLAAVTGPRPENLPIEPTSIQAALLEAFGPNPPDETFHLPARRPRLAMDVRYIDA